MPIPKEAANAPARMTRALIAACLVLLIAVAILLSRVATQRAELAAQAIRVELAEQETRALRQQLEAERLLYAGQSRLLREALGGTATAAAAVSPTPPVAQPEATNGAAP